MQEDKRRLLLDAAVKVFAHKGYHASRVGDIAEKAGVAYGLVYHYFESKEDVLRSVFRETWRALIATIKSVDVPTLILAADEDQLTPVDDSRKMQSACTKAELEILPRTGHLANLETPDAFNAALSGFLGRI